MKTEKCPFCGNEEILVIKQITGNEPNEFGIMCGMCGAGFGMSFETEEKAIQAWNKRRIDENA